MAVQGNGIVCLTGCFSRDYRQNGLTLAQVGGMINTKQEFTYEPHFNYL